MEISITVETCPEGINTALEKTNELRKQRKWPENIFNKRTGKPILVAKFTMVYLLISGLI